MIDRQGPPTQLLDKAHARWVEPTDLAGDKSGCEKALSEVRSVIGE